MMQNHEKAPFQGAGGQASKSPRFLFLLLFVVISGNILIGWGVDMLQHRADHYMGERNNAWTYYAGKSIKSRLYEIQRNNISLILDSVDFGRKEAATIIETAGQNLDHEIERYKDEQNTIQAEAIKFDNLYADTIRKLKILEAVKLFYQIFALALILAGIRRLLR